MTLYVWEFFIENFMENFMTETGYWRVESGTGVEIVRVQKSK